MICDFFSPFFHGVWLMFIQTLCGIMLLFYREKNIHFINLSKTHIANGIPSLQDHSKFNVTQSSVVELKTMWHLTTIADSIHLSYQVSSQLHCKQVKSTYSSHHKINSFALSTWLHLQITETVEPAPFHAWYIRPLLSTNRLSTDP